MVMYFSFWGEWVGDVSSLYCFFVVVVVDYLYFDSVNFLSREIVAGFCGYNGVIHLHCHP